MGLLIRRGDLGDVEMLRTLWVSMVEHHREVAGREWPVRSADDAWRRRRDEYVAWLGDGTGTLFLAGPRDTGSPLGYAMLHLHPPGATWDLGALVGELESLAVRPEARGEGVGTALIAACRDELRRRGIEYWAVAYVEANDGAQRLYERAGFRAYYRNMLARVDRGDG